MKCEFFISGAPEGYIRFVIERFLKKGILCVTTAKRNITDGSIIMFGQEIPVKMSIRKGERYFVIKGDWNEWNVIKRQFFPFWNIKVYPAEYIICQKKWRGQPYKFFFRDNMKGNR